MDRMPIGQILAELELLSHGTTTAWNHAGGGGIPSSREPSGEPSPPHEQWAQRYEQASLKEPVRAAAQAALEAWKVRTATPTHDETQGELEQRIIDEGQGWTVAQVALHCRTSEKLVRQARLRAGAHPDTGADATKAVSHDGRVQRAREMASEGLTERQIVMLTRLPKTTVRRVLGRAA